MYVSYGLIFRRMAIYWLLAVDDHNRSTVLWLRDKHVRSLAAHHIMQEPFVIEDAGQKYYVTSESRIVFAVE